MRYGTEEAKQKYLPDILEVHVSFAVTEPDAGTNTTQIDLRDSQGRRLRGFRPEGLYHEGERVEEDVAPHADDAV